MKKLGCIFFLVLAGFSVFAHQTDSLNTPVRLKLVTGVGPMNIGKNVNTGIALNNSLELMLKDWLFLSGNLHLGKSGNNTHGYTYFVYYPDFPDRFETNFYETDLKKAQTQSFSSMGIFALLNPFKNKRTRFNFGPGVCYVSWEEVTTVFSKGFRDSEYYEISTRVTNRKKMDIGVQFNIETDISKNIFAGVRFQGYLDEESASGISFILGFKLL